MKTVVFSTKPYDRRYFDQFNTDNKVDITYLEPRLTAETVSLANGHQAVCVFTNDDVSADIIEQLAGYGVKLIALRCAGFNNVDLAAAEQHGLTVVRVPAYSPYAVAEHTVALMLGLNRHLHKAYNRVREGNFALEGLMGFDLHGKTIGLIGTGKIGAITAGLLNGFGCQLLAVDKYENADFLALTNETGRARYVELDELLASSDVISLHCPLTPETHHIIDATAIAKMKLGAMVINTSRGALVDTQAVIEGLKSGKVGSLGLDVYEEESDLFFENLSDQVIQDDVFSRLLTFPNVLITGHQAFFTHEAMSKIAETTLTNIQQFAAGAPENTVSAN
jgi:D-lactate dehydrogenase